MTRARLSAPGNRLWPMFRGVPRRVAALALAALCGVAACGDRDRPASGAADAAAAPANSGANPRVAAVFRLARDPGGVRVALDSIHVLVAREQGLRNQGHQLAHTLGRVAVAERGSLSVLAECTPVFQSGCIHGAVEGFFVEGGTADAASVRGICAAPSGAPRPGYERLECWHGLGHGLMVQSGGDIARVLPLCDVLETATARRECQDGAFMERANRAVGFTTIGGDGGAVKDHAHGGHGTAAPSAAPPSEAQLKALCGGIDAPYQPSCWLYQPVALVAVHGLKPRPVLRACDGAPAVAVSDCYRGFGKVYLAARGQNSRAMIRACGQGNRAHATACLLGGVEYFTDLAWTIEPGVAFCRRVPRDARPACYEMIGARLALIHPDPERAAAGCQRVERAWAQACLTGARRAGS